MNRYTNACRICLKEDGINIPIFGDEGQYRRIADKIRDCLTIPIYKSDPLPKNLCNRCYYKLDLASELKAQSQRSNAIFIHFLSTLRSNRAAFEYLKLVQDRPMTQTPLHPNIPPQKRKMPVPSEDFRSDGRSDPKRIHLDRQTRLSSLENTSSFKSYICRLCDKPFEYKQDLIKHTHKIHGPECMYIIGNNVATQTQETKNIASQTEEASDARMDSTLKKTIGVRVNDENVDNSNINDDISECPMPILVNEAVAAIKEQGIPEQLIPPHAIPLPKTRNQAKKEKSKSAAIQNESPSLQIDLKITRDKEKISKPKLCEDNISVADTDLILSSENESLPMSPSSASVASDMETPMEIPGPQDTAGVARTRGYGKSLFCPMCNQKFYLPVNLASHVLEKHGVERKRKISPPSIQASKDLPDHTNKALASKSETDAVFECEVCHRVFRSPTKFADHCLKMMHMTSVVEPTSTTTNTSSENVSDPEIAIINKVEKEIQETTEIQTESNEPSTSTPDKRMSISCTLCSVKFKNNFGLINHTKNAHHKLLCSECLEVFDTQDELDDHLLMHDLQTNYSDASVMEVQQSDATETCVGLKGNIGESKSEYDCLYCYETFPQSAPLISHHMTAHNRIGCNECWDAFSTEKELLEHKIHHSGRDNVKAVKLHNILRLPKSKDGPLICNVCKASFHLRNILFKHVKNVHKISICHFCLNTYENNEIDAHRISCNVSKKNEPTNILNKHTSEITCECCMQNFDNYTVLWSHLNNKHPKITKFKCQKCEMIFYQQSSFDAHKACKETKKQIPSSIASTLTPEKTVARVSDKSEPTCPSCYKTYTTWNNVRRHLKEVHEVQQFPCNLCTKTYLTQEILKAHYNTQHPGVDINSLKPRKKKTKKEATKTPMCCKYCLRTFTKLSWFNAHLAGHTKNNHKEISTEKINLETKQKTESISSDTGSDTNVPIVSKTARKSLASKSNVVDISSTESDTNLPIISKTARKSLPSKSNVVDISSTESDTNLPIVKKTARKSFPSKSKVADTSSTESVTKKFICDYCSKNFDSALDLKNHLANNHPLELYFLCSKCDEVCFDIKTLESHTLTHRVNHFQPKTKQETPAKKSVPQMKLIQDQPVKSNIDKPETRKSSAFNEHSQKMNIVPSMIAEVLDNSSADKLLGFTPPELPKPISKPKIPATVKSSQEVPPHKIQSPAHHLDKSEKSKHQSPPSKTSSQSVKISPPPISASSSKSGPSERTSMNEQLRCQFCNAFLSNAIKLIEHLQQHARTG